VTRGVYPGSFDPLTTAHVAIADAAHRHAHLDRLDLAISRVALGKEQGGHAPVAARVEAIERAAQSRPWLHPHVTDALLIADIAAGYDVVVMGADKWAQVRDPAWYGADVDARDAALAALPRVLVAPRPGFDTDGAEVLAVDPTVAGVSSTRARAGEAHLVAFGEPGRIIVDGNNVIGSTPDGWWRDRARAAQRLVGELQRYARRSGARVAVVFDGRPLPDFPEAVHDGVLVAYATRRGANAADDRIADEVARDRDPASLTVVTSDRALAGRVRAAGARVLAVGSFSRALGSEDR
jgi:nicotinic acid mononucleotide adenylyltransferase/predicted RNA-binding protein with PIN domain